MSIRFRTYRGDRALSVQLHVTLFGRFYRFSIGFDHTPVGPAL